MGGGEIIFLRLVGLYLSSIAEPAGIAKPEVLRKFSFSARAGKRIWLGEGFQRTSLFRLPAELWRSGARRTVSRRLRPGRTMAPGAGKSAGSDLPQGGRSSRRRRD